MSEEAKTVNGVLIPADNENKVSVKSRPCPRCGKVHVLRVYPSHLDAYEGGGLIQNTLTELSADEREMLITGLCPECWGPLSGREVMTPEEDISGWRTNKNFLKWMTVINPSLDKEDVKLFSPEKWLGGWCEDFALYFAVRWNVPMLFLAHEHNLVKIDGKYYDGADTHGKERLQDMQFVREHLSLYTLTEEELEKLLIVDEDWKGYEPLAGRVYLIEKKAR